MKQFSIVTSLIILTQFVSFGCGPKQKVAEETRVDCVPENLIVSVDDGSMDVAWTSDCPKNISGYNIYISDQPIAKEYPGNQLPEKVKPFNLTPFAGDTNPEDGVEHFEAEHLENGKKYFVSVRTLYPDRTISKPSNEAVVVCGPRGELELSIRYKSDHDGYSFSDESYVKSNDSKNDLYFFSKEGKDYLVSPVQLDSFLKANKLRKLSFKGDFDTVRKKAADLSDSPTDERVEVKKGDWLWLINPDHKSTLVNVMDISGNGEDRKIKLFYAYSPIADEMIF